MPLIDVLRSKHLDTCIPEADHYDEYQNIPDAIDAFCFEEDIMKQASKLSGAVGPSGVDAETMKHWLLQYNVVSEKLGKEMAEWVTLLSNSSLDYYEMYHAFDSSRMLAVDI